MAEGCGKGSIAGRVCKQYGISQQVGIAYGLRNSAALMEEEE